MMSLGSKKYPNEETLKEFVKINGGQRNASTNDFVTCYQVSFKLLV